MRKTTTLLLTLISLCSSAFSVPNILSYECLVNNPYSDHVQHFQKLFAHTEVHSFLEFGLGLGTKYFLDHCEEVTSCEILLPSQSTEWFERTRALFSDCSHWTSLLKRASPAMQFADRLFKEEKKDPALYDATYLLELKEICDELFEKKQFEVVFVDPGFHMRGDLVNELFGRAPIIVAHNTNVDSDYGWRKVDTPSDYEKIIFTQGQGTTFWIHKERRDLITALKGAPSSPISTEKKLRIFFPDMHHMFTRSMITAMHALGHTLVLPGESFSVLSPTRGHKLHQTAFHKKDPSLPFEVIENREILFNPPDVLCVNCWESAREVCEIWRHLKKLGYSPKLMHYAGNNGVPYDASFVKNLIATDAYTASYFDPSTVNIISWIPWVDFENLPFEGVSDNPFMGTYLGHYYEDGSMRKSADCFYDTINRAGVDFPNFSFQLFPVKHQFLSHQELVRQMDLSCATLHIKETEGLGYTIIESLAKGRPVFLKRSFSTGSRLMNWCIEGKTAFFFDSYEEFRDKLQKYSQDREYRHRVQRECAATVRYLIDNEKQLKILENFINNLQ